MTIIDEILRRESAEFTDDPLDPGGPTKYGITSRSWEAYIAQRNGIGVPAMSVEFINEADAREFYRHMYVEPVRWIHDESLRDLMIDCAVNSGAKRAMKWLQRAAQCTAIDGVAGPETYERVNAGLADMLYAFVLIARFKHYAAIVHRDHTQSRFIEGWINRACEFIRP